MILLVRAGWVQFEQSGEQQKSPWFKPSGFFNIRYVPI